MQVFWILWEVTINIIEYCFFSFMLRRKLGVIFNRKKRVAIGLIIIIVVQTIMNCLGVNFQIVMLIMLFFDLLYAFTSFGGTVAMRFMWGCSGMIVILTANLLTSVILSSIFSMSITDTLSPSITRIGATLIYASASVILFFALSKIPNVNLSLPRNLQILLIATVTFGTILAGQIVAFALDTNFSRFEHFILIIFSFSLLLMLFVIIFLVHKIGSAIQNEANAENKLRSAQLEQQNQERLQEVMRLWNHDQHHHINVLQSFVSKKDLSGVGQYLREMNSELETLTTLVNTSNSVIDGILTSKIHICRAEKIAFKINAKNLDNFPLSKMECSSLLGNLLDNAIDACKKCRANESVYIECNIYRKRGMYVIIVTNSSNGEYCYDAGELITSKSEGLHGYGLPQIKQIVEESKGLYRISSSQKKFRFEIYLPYTEGDNNS